MRHISTLRLTTKSLDKSFVFKKSVVEKGLAERAVTGLGAGGPRFKSGRPDQSFQRVAYFSFSSLSLHWSDNCSGAFYFSIASATPASRNFSNFAAAERFCSFAR